MILSNHIESVLTVYLANSNKFHVHVQILCLLMRMEPFNVLYMEISKLHNNSLKGQCAVYEAV